MNADVRQKMKTCPNCKLENPSEAEECDCSYSFATKTSKAYPTVFGKKFGIPFLILCAGLLTHLYGWVSIGSPEEKVTINLRMPDSVIGKRLLTFTPIGTESTNCVTFIENHLTHLPDTPIFYVRKSSLFGGRSFIKARLGFYTGYLLVNSPCIYVTWNFDKEDRLSDIQVETLETSVL